MSHRSINGGGYGQNIGYGVAADEVAVLISNGMYNNEVGYFDGLYGQASPDMRFFEKWGHFSQIVWMKTIHVGCATVSCNELENVESKTAVPFTVCNYWPPGEATYLPSRSGSYLTSLQGNFAGEYADNIARPLGHDPYSP
jgi:hypothetical protein